MRVRATVIALSSLLLVGASTATAAASNAAIPAAYGCPSGAVCVYPQNAGWNGGHPSLFFYSYGAHNLSNQFGTHRVFNHQYGGLYAFASTCLGYDGTGRTVRVIPRGSWSDENLTPINSIVLARPQPRFQVCSGGF
jgi:hypothetical protein